jgi:hypothetical protein
MKVNFKTSQCIIATNQELIQGVPQLRSKLRPFFHYVKEIIRDCVYRFEYILNHKNIGN